MGVPGLATWLKRRYADAFHPLPADFICDNVYIDMSSILHQVIRRARTKAYFHMLLHRRLDEVLATVQPQQRVVLALDGPAPLAKLLEQRRRRRRESEKVARTMAAVEATKAGSAAVPAAAAAAADTDAPELLGEAEAAAAAAAAGAGEAAADGQAASGADSDGPPAPLPSSAAPLRRPNPELSTLALTTGSLLMLEVHQSLAAYICKKLADPATSHLSFELSDSTVKGEGELKILSRLLHPSTLGGSQGGSGDSGGVEGGQQERRDETHLVLGADSDLLLMALVAGQKGVFILPEMPEESPQQRLKRRRRLHRGRQRAQPAVSQEAAALPAGFSDESVDSSSGSEAETDAELSGPESEGEEESADDVDADLVADLAATLQAPTQAAPLPLVFSRDTAERLWRQQHLDGEDDAGAGQGGVTALALDLMLLSLMCSGNDYLPAIQGMQLSNKHRPGLWDLYTSMRRQPEWRGHSLAVRLCDCEGQPDTGYPAVQLNAGMLGALLAEYYRQRFVYLEAPMGGSSSLDADGSEGAPGSADGSMDVPAGGGGGSSSPVVWDSEGLAAAAALATSSPASGPDPAAGGKRRPITLRGLESRPEGYMQGLEWVLAMYCTGSVSDYRFSYDFAAPSLPQLLETLERMAEAQVAARRAAADGGKGRGRQGRKEAVAPRHRQRRSVQPLLPAACAMALLPRGGRAHAATALRHLMDEGSALDEIYAVCDTCTRMGQQMGSLSRELDAARGEHSAGQLRLATALAEVAAGRPGAQEAVAALQAEVEQQGAEVARLKVELSALSRSQQEHLAEAHPYKPFPTEQLEAAVAAVPLEQYPRRERKLAQFGREFVFWRQGRGKHAPGSPRVDGEAGELEAPLGRVAADGQAGPGVGGASGRAQRWGGSRRREVAAAAAAPGAASESATSEGEDDLAAGGSESEAAAGGSESGAGEEVEGDEPLLPRPARPRVGGEPLGWTRLQPWVEDCLSFAAAYPRVADPFLIRQSNWGVQREVLPLRPYMQPPRTMRRVPDGGSGKPSALLATCQLMRWSGVCAQQPALRVIGLPRRQGLRQQQAQRSTLHTLGLAAPGAAGRPLGRAASVRTALGQSCARLLHQFPRMLRAL